MIVIDILRNNSYVSLVQNNLLYQFDSFHIHNHQILPLFGFCLPFHLLVLSLHLSNEIFYLFGILFTSAILSNISDKCVYFSCSRLFEYKYTISK